MSLLAQIAKKFAPSEYHSMIDAGVDAMGRYSHDKNGALQLIKDMGGTTQDVQKMISIANSDERIGKLFNALNINRQGLNHAANELMSTGVPTHQGQDQSSSIEQLRQRVSKLK